MAKVKTNAAGFVFIRIVAELAWQSELYLASRSAGVSMGEYTKQAVNEKMARDKEAKQS